MKSFSVSSVDNKKKVFLVHPNLRIGGAERQIGYLLKWYDRSYVELILVVFSDPKSIARELSRQYKFKMLNLGDDTQPGLVKRLVYLYRLIKREKPEVVYTFLPNTNLINATLSFFVRSHSVVWGLRASSFSATRFGWKGNVATWVTPFLSNRVDLLISNTVTGLEEYQKSGVQLKKAVVIPNGIDSEAFAPRKEERDSIRRELGITSELLVIGMVARIVDWKGYDYFLQAAELLLKQQKLNVGFLCVGSGDSSLEEKYKNISEQAPLKGRCYWLGERDDVDRVLNAMDILTVASVEGEGFPNAIGEAMATGIPVVSTDIGDSRYVLGDTGLITEAANAEAICHGWTTLLSEPALRGSFQKKGRTRILETYSVSRCVTKTINELLQLQ
jgi:glycosyltransferase involved in cell wall biosynthesis